MNVSSNNEKIALRYEVKHVLGSGGFGTVYAVFDRLHNQTVALKRIQKTKTSGDNPSKTETITSTREMLTLANEFRVLASLRHPNIIHVLDYGFDREQAPFFTMRLLEEPLNITQAAYQSSVRERVQLFIQLLQALSYLHRRGVVHRDLKPDNALVTADDMVKVLDFGLAYEKRKASADQMEDGNLLAGTIAYIPPEVLQGSAPDERSDLYAVGVIGYEIFAGRHPFNLNSVSEIINQTLFTPPDLLPIYQLLLDETPLAPSSPPPSAELMATRPLELPEIEQEPSDLSDTQDLPVIDIRPSFGRELARILERLLEKSPEDRFSSASEVISELYHALGEETPPETIEIRESYLQAADFVGREVEYTQLNLKLHDALQGHGSSCLIGGESGVGKSRLIEQIQTKALVEGMLMLHGQAVSEGGLPYHLWREPLRRMLISEELAGIRPETASVLRQIVPDIANLINQPVEAAPEISGPAGKARLFRAIAEVFREIKAPTLLVLEDLHWTDESLDVLKYLLPLLKDSAILVVGSYSSDERPGLPEELPGMDSIMLERFSMDSMRSLSVSILGEVGSDPQLLDLLARETEGNVFFFIEVVRALAEETGGLNAIGHMDLPQRVLAGGIQSIVERRLGRIPAEARELLRVAALIGRRLELDLLKHLSRATDMTAWLAQCSNGAVITVYDGKWSFAHEKLREGLIASLAADERRTLHHRIAEGIQLLRAQELDEYSALIADHYEQAGDEQKATRWHYRAGIAAERTYIYTSALIHYKKALDYMQRHSDVLLPEEQIRLYGGLGLVYNRRADYENAREMYHTMQSLAENHQDKESQAQAWRGIAYTYMYEGNFQQAISCAQQCITFGQEADAPHLINEGLSIQGWSNLFLGELDSALKYGEEALDIAHKIDNRARMADNLNLLGAVRSSLGRLSDGESSFKQAFQIAEHLGDRVLATTVVNNLGYVASMRGDYVSAVSSFRTALSFAREAGDRSHEIEWMNSLGTALVKIGEYEEAETHLTAVLEATHNTSFRELPVTLAYLAEVQLAFGLFAVAMDTAARAMETARETEAVEHIGLVWRALAKIAAGADMPVQIDNDSQIYSATQCFEESLRLFSEAGNEGEKAETLRAWAAHEIADGRSDKGSQLWDEARQIFADIGADLAVSKMDAQRPSELGS